MLSTAADVNNSRFPDSTTKRKEEARPTRVASMTPSKNGNPIPPGCLRYVTHRRISAQAFETAPEQSTEIAEDLRGSD